MKILILGGTAEARALAARLVAMGHEVVTSLAGRTQDPILPAGELRVGGFGGAIGLAAYLSAAEIARLVDATHPYAAQISANAVEAAAVADVPLVRFMRPRWEPAADDEWVAVGTLVEAAAVLPAGARVLLTTGQGGLDYFFTREDCRLVVRTIEVPAMPLPPHARLVQQRPPYSLADELTLMEREGITHLVTKNSGGGQTAAKLEAARQKGVTVVMIARPAYRPATEAASIEDAIAALGLAG